MEDTYKYRFVVSKVHKLYRALGDILDYARERSMTTYRISLSEVEQYIKRLSDVSIPTPEEIGSIPISPLMEVTEYFMYDVVIKDSSNIVFEFHTEPLKTSYVEKWRPFVHARYWFHRKKWKRSLLMYRIQLRQQDMQRGRMKSYDYR